MRRRLIFLKPCGLAVRFDPICMCFTHALSAREATVFVCFFVFVLVHLGAKINDIIGLFDKAASDA